MCVCVCVCGGRGRGGDRGINCSSEVGFDVFPQFVTPIQLYRQRRSDCHRAAYFKSSQVTHRPPPRPPSGCRFPMPDVPDGAAAMPSVIARARGLGDVKRHEGAVKGGGASVLLRRPPTPYHPK